MQIEAIARQHSGDPVRISEALVTASQERVKAKDVAERTGQPIDALTNRGKDDDRSAVAIRITPEAIAEITSDQPRIAQETLDAWRRLDDDGLEKTIGEYQRILRARREGKPVIASQISRADGMREAYFDATDRERPAILVRDGAYKRAALEAIDGVYIERHVPTETLAKWEDETTTSLEETAQRYRVILDVYDQGLAPPVSAISRVHGLREAYQRARTDAEGRDALRRDRLYKEMATRALDRILARRAGGAFADDYDLLDQPAKAQRLLSMYEDRLQLLEDRYKAREQEAGAVTRFHWPEDASDAQIHACLAAEREHVRRRIRQAKRSLQASGRKPGRAAGTNPPQARA